MPRRLHSKRIGNLENSMRSAFWVMDVIRHVNIGATLALAAWLIFSPSMAVTTESRVIAPRPTANYVIGLEVQT